MDRKMIFNELPLVLQVKELAAVLSISQKTAYALVRSGAIRSIRVGRSYRIPREAVKEYIDENYMRQGELLGLSWENVNFLEGTITVRQQLQCKNGKYFLETPKNGKVRKLLPAPIVMEALHSEKWRIRKTSQ